jgi:hypothetical protein
MAPRERRPAVGDRLRVALHTERVVLFDTASTRLMPSAATVLHQPGMKHG